MFGSRARFVLDQHIGDGLCVAALKACVERVDERVIAGALPAWLDCVHHVGERDAGVGVGETECTAGAEVTEAPRVRTEGPVRPRRLEAEPERRLPLEDRAPP